MVARTPPFTLIGRALRLRCPCCGKGRLYTGMFKMVDHCPECGIKIEREPGFFLGSIYANYGVTAMLTFVIFALLRFGTDLPKQRVLAITLAVAVLFPTWFFRYARSIWLAFDQYHDPREQSAS